MQLASCPPAWSCLPRCSLTPAYACLLSMPLLPLAPCSHFARTRPLVVVPGLNHADFSNGAINSGRGDIAAEPPTVVALKGSTPVDGIEVVGPGGQADGSKATTVEVDAAGAASGACVPSSTSEEANALPSQASPPAKVARLSY